ncbi:MAG: hypothetical protein LBH06_01425 [Rikenellaceae bacterium]|jgi:hypothetical protein|nr:hypothetical protein [Rikenellaceae bacterium]
MKRDLLAFIATATLAIAITLANNNDHKHSGLKSPPENTHMGFIHRMSRSPSHTAGDGGCNSTAAGTLDLYLLSADGNTLLAGRRFSATDPAVASNPDVRDAILHQTTVKTTHDNKRMLIVLNSSQPLMTSIPPTDTKYMLSTTQPLSLPSGLNLASRIATMIDGAPDPAPFTGRKVATPAAANRVGVIHASRAARSVVQVASTIYTSHNVDDGSAAPTVICSYD